IAGATNSTSLRLRGEVGEPQERSDSGEPGEGEFPSTEQVRAPHPNPLPVRTGRGSRPRSRHQPQTIMQKKSDQGIVSGAGPVGLCLSLALAQAGVQVCVIEALGEDNFLEQVPRAGTNHPATLELLERIGLYDKLEPRGIIAPLVHYWDRRENRLIAEFD